MGRDDDETRWVIITAQCHQRLAALTTPGYEFHNTGISLGDGRFKIPLHESTLDRITQHQLPGEALGDTIERVLCSQQGRN